ncbi:hypothetical protein Slala03_70470 [Streptomyces lavendulae subsp. lavendulae]|nr:hypothetical protein Slala03_70470 [Streptomyces lavendulae subsp. lavendulae]
MVVVGLFRDGPVSTASAAGHASALGEGATTVGALLLLKAFAAGCSALTGVEAVANAVPSFRAPAARVPSGPRSPSAPCSASCSSACRS